MSSSLLLVLNMVIKTLVNSEKASVKSSSFFSTLTKRYILTAAGNPKLLISIINSSYKVFPPPFFKSTEHILN